MTASAFKNSWAGFSSRPADFAALSIIETFAQTKRRGGFLGAARRLVRDGLIHEYIRGQSWMALAALRRAGVSDEEITLLP